MPHERLRVEARVLLFEQAFARATVHGPQPPLAVLAGEVQQSPSTSCSQAAVGEIEVGSVLLQGRHELVDSLRRGQRGHGQRARRLPCL